MITNDIIDDFLLCKYKAHQIYRGESGVKTEFELLDAELLNLYKERYYNKVQARIPSHNILQKYKFGEELQDVTYAMESILNSSKFKISFDALEIVHSNTPNYIVSYIPIMVSSKEEISKLDKLSFCIKCLILKDLNYETSEYGKIIYGQNLKSTKFLLSTYMKDAKKILKELTKTVSSEDIPSFCKNQHCQICEFQKTCRTKFIEKDDLSLLGGMSQKEILKKNNKGIFSVQQLSYTFRPKKRKGRSEELRRVDYALKALALRDQKTYIQEIPKLPVSKTEIYLDFEGLSDENFIYLIGMIIRKDQLEKQFSFWADCLEEEEHIFRQFFNTLKEFTDFTIYHYGSYEIQSLKRFNKKLENKFDEEFKLIISKAVNILPIFTSNVYPPTYTNGQKDIANFLGFKWSDPKASGIQTIVWRKNWELSKDAIFKNKLIQYNIEDCLALKAVKDWVANIGDKLEQREGNNIANVNDIKIESYHKWGKPNFQLPELKEINKYSYFDYQRSKIYLRTNKTVREAVRNKTKINSHVNKVDKILHQPFKCCPNCNHNRLSNLNDGNKTIIDLKFMKYGIKKWIAKVWGSRFRCNKCGEVFKISKHGHNLKIWCINQYVTYRISAHRIGNMLLENFNIQIPPDIIYRFKSDLATRYRTAFEEIKQTIINGPLIQVDETKTAVRNNTSGYIWVFATMDSVFYLFKPNRESEFLKDLLKEFNGVLVSDFYKGYESLTCQQQRCLIHLIRDLNGDLLNNQLNTEYKYIVTEFGSLLRRIVETIDRYGLKRRHLNKHKKDVEKFFDRILNEDYETDLAIKYQKRFKKNKDTLFNFLNYDGVPWNNNNAENAIKPFAKYRENANALATEDGIKDYLVLLSIQQTCKYRGISFLNFLKSNELSIERYCRKHQ